MTHITYHDVSHFQPNYQPTGPTCAKATEGTGYTDPEYSDIKARTLAGGWPFLAYHFLRHGNIAAQVAHCVSVVGQGQPLMLDVETANDGSKAMLADTYAFCDQYAATGGQVTLAYIPEWYWRDDWGHPLLTGLTARGIGLVSSYYTDYSDTGPGWHEYMTTQHGIAFTSGVLPTIWQYTDAPIDTNAFKGTVAELAALWAGSTSGGTDMALTQADADLVKNTILNAGLGSDGDPIVQVALDRAAQAAHASDLVPLQNAVTALTAQVESLTAAVQALAAPSATGTFNVSGQLTLSE